MRSKIFLIVILNLVAVLLSVPLLGCSKPPEGLESPRVLTEAEKQKVIQIALQTDEAQEWLKKENVFKTQLIWMAIVWENSDFSAFYSIRYEWMNDDNLKNVPHEAVWYPSAFIRFGEPEKWQVTVAVDLNKGKAVYVNQNPYRTGPIQDIEISRAPIHEVLVNIAESYPPQVILYIKGGLSDGCTTFHELTTQRNGNVINIQVTTQRPKEALCTQVYSYFEKNVNLGSDFVSGETYIINVNDYNTSFEMQ